MKTSLISEFKDKVNHRKIRIAVVGLGYVGLPLAVEFARKGFSVLGIDLDRDRLERLNSKKSYISDVSSKDLARIIDSGRFKAVGNFGALKDIDVVLICVPTPLKRKYHPDISFIKSAVKRIAGNIKPGALVILESTTYPGTTEEVILPLLEAKGHKHGKDFYLCFSPERIDPGNLKYPLAKIPKVIGGISKEAAALAFEVYSSIIKKVVLVSSSRVAETVKLLENTFRIVNIGLIDEMAMMAHKMDIDIWEVIEAAKTKPFGFMPFYPGPGVGGHCLDKEETLCVKDRDSLKIMRIKDFIRYIEDPANNKINHKIEVLSFDPLKRESVFKEVTAASVRPYTGGMVDIATIDGRHLKVTELHPLFIYNANRWQLKYAKDISEGDNLPIPLGLPNFGNRLDQEREVDILGNLPKSKAALVSRVRLKPIGFSWRDYADQIKSVLRKDNSGRLPDICWDYLTDNVLPLKYFYALEKIAKIDHHRLKLVTGRGASYNEVPAVIALSEDFCRLVGYYLSEGCDTKDKSARIRFTFNRAEKEYIQDLLDILRRLGIRASIFESKASQATCIKVSSNLFGFLIDDLLDCGHNCYDMKIPEQIFSLGQDKKKALLSGILRGDGCVEHFFGKWRYCKNKKEYFHKVNTANVSYFTSSRLLFQQLIILLQDLNIIPTFKKRKYAISIFGYQQLTFCKDLFAGKKKEIIQRYLELNKNRPRNKTFRKFSGFATVKVKSVSDSRADQVYSIETEKPHTFVSSYGIAVHNCIPKDPLYLYWKAKHHGFRSRFIKLASDVISFMPEYVVGRLEKALKECRKSLQKARILIIGVTYKKNIKDLRKSPALEIVDILQKRGIKVSYSDPLIPYLKLSGINLKSQVLNKLNLSCFDCVVIATDHSSIDYHSLLKYSQLIFDTRNAFRGIANKKIIRL